MLLQRLHLMLLLLRHENLSNLVRPRQQQKATKVLYKCQSRSTPQAVLRLMTHESSRPNLSGGRPLILRNPGNAVATTRLLLSSKAKGCL